MGDKENPFKKSDKTTKSPPPREKQNTLDMKNEEEKPGNNENAKSNIEDENDLQKAYEEKLLRIQNSNEEKKKLLSGNFSGTLPKLILCVECNRDTKDYIHIVCGKCNKSTHIECVNFERFDS